MSECKQVYTHDPWWSLWYGSLQNDILDKCTKRQAACTTRTPPTKQVTIADTKDVVGSVQRLFPSLLARIELLDGLQEDTEAVIGQPLPALNSTIDCQQSKAMCTAPLQLFTFGAQCSCTLYRCYQVSTAADAS